MVTALGAFCFPETTLHLQSARLRMLFYTLVGLVLWQFSFPGFYSILFMDLTHHACSAAAATDENMVMAAPVPNPEAGTSEGLSILGVFWISVEARVGVPLARASGAGCLLIFLNFIHLRKVAIKADLTVSLVLENAPTSGRF